MKWAETLSHGCAELEIEVSAEALEVLEQYYSLLSHWNRTHRLIGDSEPNHVAETHFLDSLALLRIIPHEPDGIADIGSGAGFPGAVLAIARPAWSVRLIEPLAKRVSFLVSLKAHAGLANLTVQARRSDDMAEAGASLLVSRATLPPPKWVVEAARLLSAGGGVVLMSGRGADADTLRLAEGAGLELRRTDRLLLPLTGAARCNQLFVKRGGDASASLTGEG